jgi:allophanate hydrolase
MSSSASGPLAGKTFAVKDNMDVAGLPTTAACPEFSYIAKETAPAVQRLLDAGAVLVGKTNLDQFATGLVGVRSPYGVPKNPFNAEYIPGGSSSGSAVAVATGQVDFSLGTDTAGSGRVPAAFNNIVGLKPTRGLISTRSIVPACRSLDCVSIFARTAPEAANVFDVVRAFDAADAFSRPAAPPARAMPRTFEGARIGVPQQDQLEFFGNADTPALFDAFIARLRDLGAVVSTIDFSAFQETARLLYEGPWVAERYAAIREFIERKPEALHPVTREIIGGATRHRAIEAFQGYYRLQELRRRVAPVWQGIDVLVTPTAGTIYKVSEVAADPVRLNSNLGYYTNFMNLLDLAAIAVPAGFQRDGLPFGVTLAAPAFTDDALLALGGMAHQGFSSPRKRTDDTVVAIAVCGAHLSGLPLNHQLTERGARLVRKCRTSPAYRLYALTEFDPPRPGLVRGEGGAAIEVEVWDLPAQHFGSFMAGIPAPLGIGSVALEDGSEVKGFLCEAHAVRSAPDITTLGGWRQYLEGKQ